MAKVYFGKLNIKPNINSKMVKLSDGTDIEVKQYLSVEEKMDLMDRVVARAITTKGYYSPTIIDILFTLEVIFTYTNISITDKQLEDNYKIYDLFVSSGNYDIIKNAIPKEELEYVYNNMLKFIDIVFAYQNSMVGVMETVNQNYGDTVFSAEKIQESLGNKEDLKLVKDVLDKLG